MFLCPRCRDRLVRTDTPHGVFFVCRGCQGRAVALSVVRRMAGRKPARTIWIEANQEGGPAGVGCPICNREMVEVALPLDHEDAYLDVCIGCQFVWFDPKELEQLPEPAPTPTDEESLPEEVREQIAVRKAKLVAERAGAEDRPYLGPAETWKWIPGVLGMPVECEVTPVRRYTWVTWGLAAALAVVYLLCSPACGQPNPLVGEWEMDTDLTRAHTAKFARDAGYDRIRFGADTVLIGEEELPVSYVVGEREVRVVRQDRDHEDVVELLENERIRVAFPGGVIVVYRRAGSS